MIVVIKMNKELLIYLISMLFLFFIIYKLSSKIAEKGVVEWIFKKM